MKRFILFFIVMTTCILLNATAQVSNDTVQPQITESGIEYVDIPDSGHTHTSANKETEVTTKKHKKHFLSDGFSTGNIALLIPIIAIISVFSMPILVVFFAFYFKYKNKKAKYNLVQKALESGQPLPENLFQEKTNNVLNKGITNTFTGIGLFIFLWFLTNELGIACIGLLVMCTGLGQIVIYYVQNKNTEKSNPKNNTNDNNCPPAQ